MKIDLSLVKTIRSGLIRPEGVIAMDGGSIYTVDGRGTCSHIEKNGRTYFLWFSRLYA